MRFSDCSVALRHGWAVSVVNQPDSLGFLGAYDTVPPSHFAQHREPLSQVSFAFDLKFPLCIKSRHKIAVITYAQLKTSVGTDWLLNTWRG